MKRIFNGLAAILIALATVSGCALKENFEVQPVEKSDKINISGTIEQKYQTRANDTGFCNGDVVGIYIVDYVNGQPGQLQAVGNRADNVNFTFDEPAYKWNPAYDIYWKDDKTPIDIYGYYPYGYPEDVHSYPINVAHDQGKTAAGGNLSGYEASDFLWGKSENNAPTARTLPLGFNHKMASARITLQEGTGFAAGEWAAARKTVMILNTARNSTIDLSTGRVTASGEIEEDGILPYRKGDDYRGIVVPQTVPAGKSLISVSIDENSYFLKKTEDFTYVPGKLHNFTLKINKREAAGGYEFVLTSESITVWTNDDISHDMSVKEYIIVDVKEPGTLEACLTKAGKDPLKVKNLKLTGKINESDFLFMRDKMEKLRALNLKEALMYNGNAQSDRIPNFAMKGKTTLMTLILPDRLVEIGANAFNECSNLVGSLTIPEGVKRIETAAFAQCRSYAGTLYLPSTLEYIGGDGSVYTGAFSGTSFTCELKLPESLTYIGYAAFCECPNFYGTLNLPSHLSYLGECAFSGNNEQTGGSSFSGSLVIPQTLNQIQKSTFAGSTFDGNLKLHDGIESIGAKAFSGCGFRGELDLPGSLTVINNKAFFGCNFSGNLNIPDEVMVIGNYAFASNWLLTGTVNIPDEVMSIGTGAFCGCKSLSSVILGKNLESIGRDAFEGCYGINGIRSKAQFPPYVNNSFTGVPKDNFTVEVPESSVQHYQLAQGWGEFKRISSYRNLVVRPAVACAINTSVTRDLILNAEGEWFVEKKPDWVTLDLETGTGKTPLKLTFAQMPAGAETRTGEVVFMLKGKDYRTRCTVTQYNYKYAEDEIITLQTATKGKGINIFIMGDGFDALDISKDLYLNKVQEAYKHFFAIEPYKSYREYFNVYTGIAVSPESGVGAVNTIIHNKFNTTFKGGVALGGRNGEKDGIQIMKYMTKAPTITEANIDQSLAIMIPNTDEYGGICYMYDEGFAIAYCPLSNYGYPLDFRGVVQHEAGGHGFGKLGDEYINHNAFIDQCFCPCCEHVWEFNMAKKKGWYANLSLTGKMDEVPWKHFIFHEKYDHIVDIFEGGFKHSRGVFRSEHNSCMNNDVPYYSTISREVIVKRIKEYAGEPYSFDDFVAKDIIEVPVTKTKSASVPESIARNSSSVHHSPIFMGKRPSLN